MHWLDNLVRTVSPEAGLRRARARAALALVDSIAAGRRGAYDGAKGGRRTQNWLTAGGSANTAIIGELDIVRNRARDLVRNNPYASKAISTIKRHMVRTGIQAVFENKAAAKTWKTWTSESDYRGQLDFAGQQAQIVDAWEEAGEVLIRKRSLPSARGLLVPYQLEVLEADYLATWKTQQLQDGFVIAGVEFDTDGLRRAYWLYPYHPGETIPIARQLTPIRVPAEEIIHAYSIDRPGQVRGVSHLATSMLRLRDLDEYQEALLVQKKIQACFAAFVRNANGSAQLSTTAPDTTSGKRVETINPGMVEYLQDGEEITFAQPQIGPDGSYSKEQLHAIAAGAEVMYEQLTGDLSGVNYSSIRAGRQEFYALIEQKQWLELIPMVLRPISRDVMRYAYIAGAVRATGLMADDWTCPRPEFVDPLKDIEAIKSAVRGGLKSRAEGIRQSGYDPAVVEAEIKKERDEDKALGLIFDTDASVSELKGVAPGATADAGAAAANAAAQAAQETTVILGQRVAFLEGRADVPPAPLPPPAVAPSVTIGEGAIQLTHRAGDVHVTPPEPVVVDEQARAHDARVLTLLESMATGIEAALRSSDELRTKQARLESQGNNIVQLVTAPRVGTLVRDAGGNAVAVRTIIDPDRSEQT
jgi:lambda family phage portal protein